MRFKLLLILLIVFSSYNLSAWEVKSDTTVYVGGWGGLSYAKIMGYDGANSPLLGFNGGAIFYFQPKSEFSFRIGINYVQKGFVHEFEYFTVSGQTVGFYPTNYFFNYLNIPVNYIYNLGHAKFNVYLSMGFDFDFLLQQKVYSKKVPELFKGENVVYKPYTATEYYKNFNFGLNIAVGAEYKIKNNIIAIAEIKYMHGITDVYNIDNNIYYMKHRSIIVNLGLRVGIPIKYNVSDKENL